MDTIVYVETLDRPVTLLDRQNKIGLDGFIKLLQQNGWVDENENALKNFRITTIGEGNNITWQAKLK
jgi:hypothetical protein